MTVRRALTTAVLALAAWCVIASASAPTASAASISWRGCFGDLECGRLRVPLDRAGAVPGTVSLRVARGEFAGPRAEHLMYLSGGPGGAGIVEMIDVLLTVPALLGDRTRRAAALHRGGRGVRGAAGRAAGVPHHA